MLTRTDLCTSTKKPPKIEEKSLTVSGLRTLEFSTTKKQIDLSISSCVSTSA